MSTVLVLAFLHGAPVFFLGVRARSRSILTVLALISGGIALSTGSSRYDGVDLAAVVFAWLLGMVALNRIAPAPPRDLEAERIAAAEEKVWKRRAILIVAALWLAGVASLVGINYYNNNHGPCSEKELKKQQMTFQQCSINQDFKNCEAGDLSACRNIEWRRSQYREERRTEYPE